MNTSSFHRATAEASQCRATPPPALPVGDLAAGPRAARLPRVDSLVLWERCGERRGNGFEKLAAVWSQPRRIAAPKRPLWANEGAAARILAAEARCRPINWCTFDDIPSNPPRNARAPGASFFPTALPHPPHERTPRFPTGDRLNTPSMTPSSRLPRRLRAHGAQFCHRDANVARRAPLCTPGPHPNRAQVALKGTASGRRWPDHSAERVGRFRAQVCPLLPPRIAPRPPCRPLPPSLHLHS